MRFGPYLVPFALACVSIPFALGSGTARALPAPAPQHRAASSGSPISLQASVGWNGRYRPDGTTVPFRTTLHNSGSTDVRGTVEVATPSVTDPLLLRPQLDAVYTADVVLPAGSTKDVTLYLPSASISNLMTAEFRGPGRMLASTTVYPVPFDQRDITVGFLTSDPTTMRWAVGARVPRGRVVPIELTGDDVGPTPGALSTFDEIVLTNYNSAQFDAVQTEALEEYVRSGGTLLLVGGYDWQETLRPLPSALLPGRIVGSLTLSDLSALRFFDQGVPPRISTTVSRLVAPQGSAISTASGTPLVVRRAFGVGRIEYLAFDPAQGALALWPRALPLDSSLLTAAIPWAMRRLSLPEGFDPLSFGNPGSAQIDAGQAGFLLPSPFVPFLPIAVALVLVLVAVYVAVASPLGYMLQHQLRRTAVSWGGPVALALVLTGALAGAAPHRTHSTAVVGVIGVIRLDGESGPYPADSYAAVRADAAGTHVLDLPERAVPAAVPLILSFGSTAVSGEVGTRWSMGEGVHTQTSLPGMRAAGTRVIALRTALAIPGAVTSNLWVNSSGDIDGTITNGTTLHLVHLAVVAGEAFSRLPDLRPGGTIHIDIRPDANVRDHQYDEQLTDLYTRGQVGGRIQSAVKTLPDVNVASMLGEVFLAGWTTDSLGDFRLDGLPARRDDTDLILKALSVDFHPGTFRLRTGTLGAYPLDMVPVVPRYACCSPSVQGIYLGGRGSAVFEFDFPDPGRLRIHSLALDAFAGGPDTTYNGYSDMPKHAASVFNWRTRQWQELIFHHARSVLQDPGELVSPSGAMLVRIRALPDSGDLAVFDAHHDLQVSGTMTVD